MDSSFRFQRFITTDPRTGSSLVSGNFFSRGRRMISTRSRAQSKSRKRPRPATVYLVKRQAKTKNLFSSNFTSNTPFYPSRTRFCHRKQRRKIVESPALPDQPESDHPDTGPAPIALKGLQIVGGVVAVGALLTPAVLGLVGFSAIGPVAGTAAAGWQSSIGLVSAGSLFAWCQSAAMGGTAVATVTSTGIGGGIAFATATVGRYLRQKGVRNTDTPSSDDQDDDHDGHEDDQGHDHDEGHDDEGHGKGEVHEGHEGHDDDGGGKENKKNEG